MKKIILLVLLAFAAIMAFSSCGGGRNVALKNQVSPNPNFLFHSKADSPMWLYTENSFYAACHWRTEMNQGYFIFPDRYGSNNMIEESAYGMRDLLMEDLIDAVDSTRHSTPSESVVYLSEVKYEKADIDDMYSLVDPSDSLIDAIIGKVVVTMTLKSIGEETCNIPVKLFEHRLAEISTDPVRDGLLLYMAQAHSYLSTFCGVTELSSTYLSRLTD